MNKAKRLTDKQMKRIGWYLKRANIHQVGTIEIKARKEFQKKLIEQKEENENGTITNN